MKSFRVLFPFCGLGAGALGFLRAAVSLFDVEHRFESAGGIDFDADACRDFERLTKSPALCADVAKLTVEELRAFAGIDAPDVVFSSPPCQGFSGLMSETKSKEDKYQALNELVLTWTKLMLEAWPGQPPKLVLIENVPRIETRGKALLAQVKKLLRARGYVFHASSHDCGEIGGLAQHRQRYLLVARHAPSTPALLYQPVKRRVRGCGEVLSQLPLPGTPIAGPLHELPKISTLNWIRLALIPPGGDWRAIEGALERRRFNNVMRVIRWDGAVPAINGGTGPTSGAAAVADPRIDGTYHRGVYGVRPWTSPSGAVCGSSSPSNGMFAVADPRLAGGTYKGKYEVQEWDEPSRTVIGGSSNGSSFVADPRVPGCPALRIAYYPHDYRSAPPWPLVLATEDGTWHRPLTTLELAALQGLPTMLDGEPLRLAGTSSTEHRRRIGNAVPVAAAEAIARQMLITLANASAGAFALSNGGDVWVRPNREALRAGGVR